jgi:hypothetical protein
VATHRLVDGPAQRAVGGWRSVDPDHNPPLFASRPPVWDHGDGAWRMRHAVLADRSEQQPRESTATTGADDQQLGAFRRVDQRLGRVSADDHGPRVDGEGLARDQQLHRAVEDRLALRFEGRRIGEVIRKVQGVRRHPRVYDVQRGAAPLGLRNCPLRSSLGRGRAVDADDDPPAHELLVHVLSVRREQRSAQSTRSRRGHHRVRKWPSGGVNGTKVSRRSALHRGCCKP